MWSWSGAGCGEKQKTALVWTRGEEGEGDPLAVIREWEVEGRRPRGRPRKTWEKTVEEDLQSLQIDKAQALCLEEWKKIIP